ncbi:MAG: hypothetical protein ACI4V1_08795 [Eubacteriales bacterium]
MKSKTFITILAVLVLSLSIAAPALKCLEKLGILELPKMGNIIEPEKTYGDGTGGVLNMIEFAKADITDTYINYLPWYAQIVTAIQTAEVNFNQPFNNFLSSFLTPSTVVTLKADVPTEDASTEKETETAEELEAEAAEPAEPYIVDFSSRFLKSSGEGVNFYAIDVEYSDGTETGLITTAFNTPSKVYTQRMKKTAEQINAIAAANTDVNVYVYVCSRLQDCEDFESILPGEPSLYPLITEFFDLLDDRIMYDRLKVDSLEDSIAYLFKTDHHWNAFGMYTAYCDIVSMIYGEDAEDILRPLGERYDIEDADFYGTFARTSGYYDDHDDFFFYDYDLPPHTLQADYPYNFEEKKAQYLAGEFSKDLSADHYVNFYPYARYLRYPTNNTGRVVLVLGDSYSRGISELLGSAFDEAYIFDYRRIQEIKNYNDFIEKNGITDVLFMQYSLRGVFDNQNDNTLDTILLD